MTDDFCTLADIAIVTSLRDGMNLVSYEFVACQDAKKGVLILSEVTICTINFTFFSSSYFLMSYDLCLHTHVKYTYTHLLYIIYYICI